MSVVRERKGNASRGRFQLSVSAPKAGCYYCDSLWTGRSVMQPERYLTLKDPPIVRNYFRVVRLDTRSFAVST